MQDAHQLSQICTQARSIIGQVAQFLWTERLRVTSGDIEEKSRNSLVSYVDKQAEIQLVERLGGLVPGSTFLTEEETVAQEEGEWRWIIDPLDGTTNFLHGLPCFSISVALQYRGDTLIGVVHEVAQGEQFYAWKGSGAFCNGTSIRVNQTADLADCLIATGFPYYDYSRTDAYLSALKELMAGTRGIRRFGSAAVDLAYVAAGRFDAFFEHSLHPWDVAAGAFLVQEAGGRLADFKGGDNYLHGREMIAASTTVWEAFFPLVNRHLG